MNSRAAPRATNIIEKGVEAGPLRVFALRRPKPASLHAASPNAASPNAASPGAYTLVNVTSASATPVEVGRPETYAALSPFHLRTVVETPRGPFDTCVENAWQFSKVYAAGPDGRPHVDAAGAPTEAWWAWARAGWARRDAVRFPMGRGARPLYSVTWRRVRGAAAAAEEAGAPEWLEERLPYIEARRRLYAPWYAAAAEATPAFAALQALCAAGPVGLVDFDGWDHVGQGYSLAEALAAPKPKFGHAFVLAGLLTGERPWAD
jgi:hypothetical protein